MDDTDDKARRNLVIASGVVLLCAWLELPLSSLMERLSGVGALEPRVHLQAWRAWFAALAVLVYLGLRFRFADQSAKDLEALGHNWHEIVSTGVRKRLTTGLNRFTKTGTESPDFAGSLSAVVEEVTRSMAADLARVRLESQLTLGRPRIQISNVLPDIEAPHIASLFRGRIALVFIWTDTHGKQQHEGGTMPNYDISGCRRMGVKAMAVVQLVTYSRGGLQSIIPWLLAGAALTTCLIELGISWLDR